MSDDPRLTELDVECVLITRDADGEITVDGGGMSSEALLFLIESAKFIMLADFFFPDDDDDAD